MVEASFVPKDIDEYEERIMLGMTARQLFWGAAALGTGFGFYLVSYLVIHIPQDFCILGTIGISFCLFALGWAKWQRKRPFSEYIRAYWKFQTTQQKVIYSNELYYYERKEESYANLNKTKSDKKINRQECREYRKEVKPKRNEKDNQA